MSTACRARPKHNFTMECFKSVKEARAFLDYEVPKMSDVECAAKAKLIEQAQKLVIRADRKNKKRKIRRVEKGNQRFPGQPLSAPNKPAKPIKIVPYYEEVNGPHGEVVRYKLIRANGQFTKRVRTKEDPPVGSIILDLMSGLKAWRRHSDKRRSIPLTSEMLKSYRNSFLFKVRQLAAGKINLQEFQKLVSQAKAKPKAIASKKLRRKNRKNR